MKLLDFLLKLENILCVYRNFVYFQKVHKIFILLRVFIELCLITFHIVFIVCYPASTARTTTNYCYVFISSSCSVMSVLLALYYSKTFRNFAKYYRTYPTYFPNDLKYHEKLESVKKYFLIFPTISFGIIKATISIVNAYYEIEKFNFIGFGRTVMAFNIFMFDLRFLAEMYVIASFIRVLSIQLGGIVRSLEEESVRERFQFGVMRAQCRHAAVIITKDCDNCLILFDKWSAAYVTVKKCSNLCNIMFGRQIALMLGSIVIFYIVLLYDMATFSVEGSFTPRIQVMYLFALAEYILALFILSKVAQSAENSGNALRSKLATLLVHSLGCDKQYKAVRDLLRLVCTHPIRTAAFGSISVNMTLLPTCIAVCTSYTVIALQFNNIV